MKHFPLLPHSRVFSVLLCLGVVVSMLLLGTPSAHAGCGCSKPAPPPAAVRPNVTYGGMPVSLFGTGITTGQLYTVTFTAMNGTSTTVSSVQAVSKRDLADAASKSQLVVTVPSTVPLGPVGITVKQAGQSTPFLSIPDTNFTVAPQPIVIPNQVGTFTYGSYKAAVGRNGVVYVTLDLTGNTNPRTFRAQALGYPLRFTTTDAVIYNTQGFLMQLLNAPIPGLASITSITASDSDLLNYSRHEFNTYFLQHAEHQPHSTDPADANWHLDGTRHVDHDHLVLAISGKVNGAVPAPGATPSFTFHLKVATLFENGLVGVAAATLNSEATTDSFRSTDWNFTSYTAGQGDVLTNGPLKTGSQTRINGNATAASISGTSSSTPGWITGTKTITSTLANFLSVAIPSGIQNIGAISLSGGTTKTLTTGSYVVTGITIGTGSGLVINNNAGPVTLYVTGPISISGNGSITMTNPDPEQFAIYVTNTSTVTLNGSGQLYGLLYAPLSPVTLSGYSDIYGSLIGVTMTLKDSADVHYDIALREPNVRVRLNDDSEVQSGEMH